MRILHIYKDYYPVLGGIENHVRILAEAQAAAGHQVTVAVCSPGLTSSIEHRRGVRIIRSGRIGTIASMPVSLAQPLVIAGETADIVHMQSPYPLGEISAWLFQRRVPLLVTHHSDVVRQKTMLRFYGPAFRRVLLRAKRIIATSPPYIETSPWLRPVREKCVVVPLGVDPDRFTPADPAPAVAAGRLLFIGRLRYYKGLDTLLTALSRLPDVNLTIAGTGPMMTELRSLSARLQIDARVDFPGEVCDADLPGLYRQADLFVLPSNSRAEAFGTVLLEAMASGLPCITTEVGTGTSWVVRNGLTGTVVPPGNPAILADAIRELLADAERLHTMGCAGRRLVESEFTQSAMIERTMAVYGECLTR